MSGTVLGGAEVGGAVMGGDSGRRGSDGWGSDVIVVLVSMEA